MNIIQWIQLGISIGRFERKYPTRRWVLCRTGDDSSYSATSYDRSYVRDGTWGLVSAYGHTPTAAITRMIARIEEMKNEPGQRSEEGEGEEVPRESEDEGST